MTVCVCVNQHTVGASREESHALCTPIDEVAEGAVYVPINRGDITVHNVRCMCAISL